MPAYTHTHTHTHTQSFASLQGVVAGVFPTRLLGKGFLTAFGMMQGKTTRFSESRRNPFGKRQDSANLGHFLSESDKIQRILDISFRKATRISESRTFPFGKRKDSANLGQISTKKNINHLKLYVI